MHKASIEARVDRKCIGVEEKSFSQTNNDIVTQELDHIMMLEEGPPVWVMTDESLCECGSDVLPGFKTHFHS